MTNNIWIDVVILVVCIVFHKAFWWLLKFIFLWTIIKPLAFSKILAFNMKDSRAYQVLDGDMHNDIVLAKPGFCQLHQYSDGEKTNTRERQYFKYVEDNSKYKLKAVRLTKKDGIDNEGGRPWRLDRDKFYLVEKPGFELKNWTIENGGEITPWQQFCLSAGVYWMGGMLQRKVREMEIEIYKTQNVSLPADKDGHVITYTELIRVTPTITDHVRATATVYAFEIPAAEDSKGNPVNVKFTGIAINTNAYISFVENNDWPTTQKVTANAVGIQVILKHPFSDIHLKYGGESKGKKGKKGDEFMQDDASQVIAAVFSDAVRNALNSLDDGFQWLAINIDDVGAVDKELVEIIRNKYKSEVNIEIKTNEGIAENARYTKVEGGKIKMLAKRSETMRQFPQETKAILIKETFENLKAASFADDSMIRTFINADEENTGGPTKSDDTGGKALTDNAKAVTGGGKSKSKSGQGGGNSNSPKKKKEEVENE